MKIAILTGAGISAESGISTFRDIKDGLWYNYNVEEVATAEGWENNPEKVLEFHNMLRAKCKDIKPNAAHIALKELEDDHEVTIITQNVDNLHEKAGSTTVLHIHGELFKMRNCLEEVLVCDGDLNIGDLDEHDEQLRPHTVLFGEEPFYWFNSVEAIAEADVFLIIGTSFSIGYLPMLINSCSDECKVYYIDPKPDLGIHHAGSLDVNIIEETATRGVPWVVSELMTEKT